MGLIPRLISDFCVRKPTPVAQGKSRRDLTTPGNRKENAMYKQQLDKLNNLRLQGYKPKFIAAVLGISVNTVKSHIRRHPVIPNTISCEYCGKPVIQNKGRKEKRFCSDKCRITYWNKKRNKRADINNTKSA